MSRASNLAGFSTSIQSVVPNNLVVGVITATSFVGDGSELSNLPAGLGTALSSDQTSPLNVIYYTNKVLSIGSTVTIDPPDSATVAYTQYREIEVTGDADLIIADGDELIADVLGIGTNTTPLGGGSGGRVRADNFTNSAGNGAPSFPYGLTGTNLTLSGDLTVNGTQTIINTHVLDVADKNIGIGSTSTPSDTLSDGAGITIYGSTNKTWTWERDTGCFEYSEPNKFKGVVETVAVGSTYDLGGGKVILELDVRNATTYTHSLANGNVGIVSFKNMPADTGVQNGSTITVIFTQLSSTPVGNGNTTAASGIGTNCFVVGYENGATVTGISTRALVGSATTVTLSTTASDIDFVSFFVHYNGGTNTTASSYKVYATKNGGFRQGSVGV